MSTLGENLKKFRLLNNMSLQDVGKEVNVSHTAIKKYEDGILVPNQDRLVEFANIYNTTVFELMREFSGITIEDIELNDETTSKTADLIKLLAVSKLNTLLYILEIENNSVFINLSKTVVKKNYNMESIVMDVRYKLNISDSIPIYNFISILENNNIYTIFLDEVKEFTSFGGVFNNVPVLVVNSDNDLYTQRYRMATALADIILDYKRVDNYNEIKHEFAKCILMSKESMISDIGKKRSNISKTEIEILMKRYLVSKKLLLERLLDLEIISEYKYKKLLTKEESNPNIELSTKLMLIEEKLISEKITSKTV